MRAPVSRKTSIRDHKGIVVAKKMSRKVSRRVVRPACITLTTSSAEPLGQGRVLQNLTYTARQIIRAIEPHQKRVSPVLERILS